MRGRDQYQNKTEQKRKEALQLQSKYILSIKRTRCSLELRQIDNFKEMIYFLLNLLSDKCFTYYYTLLVTNKEFLRSIMIDKFEHHFIYHRNHKNQRQNLLIHIP